MKNWPIRIKITLWYSFVMIAMMTVTALVVLAVSDQMMKKMIRDNLIETVEHNIDEIEYVDSMGSIAERNDVDYFLNYKDGYLEVDDDFLKEVNQVFTSLYQKDHSLVYGENPIAKETFQVEFQDSIIQQVKVEGILYYVFDRAYTSEGLKDLWIRGIVSEKQGTTLSFEILRITLAILPILCVFAIAGGYLLAGRMLAPIKKITTSATQIQEIRDLKKRIQIEPGNDELHQLAETFNLMFERLEEGMLRERQFTSDISHELRTPMSVILAQCELTLEEQRKTEDYEKALKVILRQGRKMSGMIQDMLDFARLETRPERYPLDEMNLSDLTEDLCFDLSMIKEKEITLSWDVENDVRILGNEELITRLLTNLIQNAYRYGKQKGKIQVELKKKENAVILSVADNGIGIKKEEQSRVFQRFYQADASRSGGGFGLGLAMAYEIMKFHNGRIELESEVGVGSKFCCYFFLI